MAVSTPNLIDRWRRTCAAIGLGACDPEYRRLTRAWSGWGRHYHTIEHLTHCLEELDRARDATGRRAEVELALWFHDAVYRSYGRDNEQRCAAWATRFLREHGAGEEVAVRVRDFIMATTHQAAPAPGDAALIVDIDLSILGQSDDVYDVYEQNIRREYWWVSRRRYRAARAQVLTSFLSRATIYQGPEFQERYEAAARRNLIRAIAHLGSPRPGAERT